MVYDRLEQRLHICALLIKLQHGNTGFGRSIDEGTVQLIVICIQFQEQFQDFIHHFLGPCFRTVDLVDTDNDRMIQFQSLLQNELSLWHGTFKGVHHKDDPIHHLENTFNLSAEVRMAWGIDDINLYPVISNCCIFGEDCDATFPLDIIGVHYTLHHFLVFPECTTLFEQFVHQSGFTMINMGDDRYITNIFSGYLHKLPSFYMVENTIITLISAINQIILP